MVSAIGAARGALALTGHDIDQGYLEGRSVTHWSSYLCMAGTIVGAVGAIAGLALDSICFTAAGTLLFVTNGIACYYLKKFSVFNAVDEVIFAMANAITELYQQIVGLHHQLERINPLTEQVRAERRAWETQVNQAQATQNELRTLRENYQRTEQRLLRITSVYEPLQKAVDAFILRVSDLEKNAWDFKELSAAVKELGKTRTELQEGIKQLESGTRVIDDQGKHIGEQINKLDHLMERWALSYQNVLAQNTELKEQVDELEGQVRQFGVENRRAQELLERLEALQEHLSAIQALDEN